MKPDLKDDPLLVIRSDADNELQSLGSHKEKQIAPVYEKEEQQVLAYMIL